MSRRTCARFARAAGVSEGRIIADYEAGVMELRPVDLGAMQAVLEAAGVEFTNGGQPGVRLKAQPSAQLKAEELPDFVKKGQRGK